MVKKKHKLTVVLASLCWFGLHGNFSLATHPITHHRPLPHQKWKKQTSTLYLPSPSLKKQVIRMNKKRHKKEQVANEYSSILQIISDRIHPVFIIGTPVISSPYVGSPSEYNASDLVVNQPYVNEDLYLLQQRKQLYTYLHEKNNYPIPSTPIIDLSGKIEAQAIHSDQFGSFQNRSGTDIDLTGIELDAAILANEWTTGLIALTYDNSPPPASFSQRRIDNSNVLLERGFITFGNLARHPLYGTIGQFYVPFGQYSSGMISDPFTKMLGRTKARAIELGFFKSCDSENTLNIATFIFKGPTKPKVGNNGLHNYGANIDYTLTQAKWNLDLAGSYIANLADSFGMQLSGFSKLDHEILNPVAGLDARGTLGVGPSFSLTAEYITAAHSFSPSTFSFGAPNNLQGAKPKALHIEAAYKFNILDKPSSVAVGYGQSNDALSLLIPKKRYIATVSTSIWRDTIESIEFHHDIDYSSRNITSIKKDDSIIGTGKSGNTIILQIGLYT